MDEIIIEELTLIPIGESEPLDIRPIRVTVNGKIAPLVFDAREISSIKEYAASANSEIERRTCGLTRAGANGAEA